MITTHVRRHIAAPRSAVYRALVDPVAVAAWKVPEGMTSQVHEFDAREGGSIRVSLTYDEPAGTGKTTSRTDTYRGRFVELVPDERVVEVDEFETTDPAMQGEMTITITLADADGGTDLVAVHEGVPAGVAPADNETGWRMALDRLAALVERGQTKMKCDECFGDAPAVISLTSSDGNGRFWTQVLCAACAEKKGVTLDGPPRPPRGFAPRDGADEFIDDLLRLQERVKRMSPAKQDEFFKRLVSGIRDFDDDGRPPS